MLRIHFDAALIFMTFIHNIYKISETFPPFIRIVCCSPIVSKVKQKTLGFFFFQNSKKIGVFEIPCQVNEKFVKNVYRECSWYVWKQFVKCKKRVKYFILRVVSSRKVFQHISIYFNNNNIIIIIFRKNDCSCKFDSYSWFFSNFTWTRDETN